MAGAPSPRDHGGDLPASAPLYEVKANLFKGLSHPLRIRILEIIVREGEVAVAQLLSELEMEASHLSQHLAVLRRHHLVRSQRRASSVFYQVTYPEVAELLTTARALLARVVADFEPPQP